MTRTIRVVVVDDSPFAVEVLRVMLQSAPDVRVVGVAPDGRAGFELVMQHRPDVLLTDLHMPEMDGLALTRAVMSEAPTPILVVSGSTTEEDVFRLLGAGAVDVYLKPDAVEGAEFERKSRELAQKVRIAAGVSVVRRRLVPPPSVPSEPLKPAGPACVVAIGASTGGPQALRQLLGALPADFPVPVVCVQHISAGFLAGLVDWLDGVCEIDVTIAPRGEEAKPGCAYFAPETHHLEFREGRILEWSHGPPVEGHVPSVTSTFRSVARSCGGDAIGILLTGMGRDGADGLHDMRRRGAVTIAEAASTSLVFGMPAQAIALGAAQFVLPLPEIAERLRGLRLRS